MTLDQGKQILSEFDRLNLEIVDGLNLLTEHGIISDHVIELRDICDSDANNCIIFLKKNVFTFQTV